MGGIPQEGIPAQRHLLQLGLRDAARTPDVGAHLGEHPHAVAQVSQRLCARLRGPVGLQPRSMRGAPLLPFFFPLPVDGMAFAKALAAIPSDG
jgi:hypothetical protein